VKSFITNPKSIMPHKKLKQNIVLLCLVLGGLGVTGGDFCWLPATFEPPAALELPVLNKNLKQGYLEWGFPLLS
jgi:hypothetical protein